MKIINTADPQAKPSIVMLVYGEPGVGKTTFAATSPNPILADCEGGTKYLGLRGIHMDVAQIKSWSDMKDFLEVAKSDKYNTVIIDPLGELMDKLKRFMVALNDGKLVQKDGSPTMAGWGWLKTNFRNYLKALRDAGKHTILVAHIDEGKDGENLIKRPKVETKVSDDIVAMVDIVGYMTIVRSDEGEKRVVYVESSGDRYTAKDRTGQLGRVVPPDFSKIINAVHGTETYAWSAPSAVANESSEEEGEGEGEGTPAASAPTKTSVQDKLNKAGAKKVETKKPAGAKR